MTPWVYNDGGRAEAGFKGVTGDCVCRATAIALERPYLEVYHHLKDAEKGTRARKGRRGTVRNGVRRLVIRRYLAERGWEWTATMGIGTGCRVHLRPEELPAGRLIVSLSRHLSAVIDGVVHDIYDPSREGTRCVYGYWRQP